MMYFLETSTSEEIEQMSSLINNCQSRFGQDLLRMFLEEIAPDVTVEVSGRRVKAHKCILASRYVTTKNFHFFAASSCKLAWHI